MLANVCRFDIFPAWENVRSSIVRVRTLIGFSRPSAVGNAWEARINEICLASYFLAHACPLQFGVGADGARSSSRNDLELPPSARRRSGNLGLHSQSHCP